MEGRTQTGGKGAAGRLRGAVALALSAVLAAGCLALCAARPQSAHAADGRIMGDNLRRKGLNEEWLMKEL